MKLSISVPDVLWIAEQKKHPNKGPSEIVQHLIRLDLTHEDIRAAGEDILDSVIAEHNNRVYGDNKTSLPTH